MDLTKTEERTLKHTARGRGICPACHQTGWGEMWWKRHRMKVHKPCPYPGCELAFISLPRHVMAHQWRNDSPEQALVLAHRRR